MIGLGTIINSAGIVAGGIIGHFAGKLFRPEQQEALNKACGVSVIFIAIAGAMEGMLQIDGASLTSGRSMLVVLCLALGTVIGELLGIESCFERFGEWLKGRTGNAGDASFVNAFVTASLTVSIGAMAIIGSIQDGLLGDFSTLAVKSVLDFIIIAVMTSSMGKGAAFSDAAKGRGIGKRLMQTIEDFARAAGYERLYLETHSDLQAAIHLYEKLGFRQIDKPDAVLHSTMNMFYLKDIRA